MLENGWITISLIPKILAIEQQCWGAAPPNETSVWFRTSYPLAIEIFLIVAAIFSLAMSRKPCAKESKVKEEPVAAFILFFSSLKAVLVANWSNFCFWSIPNTLGKKLGCILPKTKLASVNANFPSKP